MHGVDPGQRERFDPAKKRADGLFISEDPRLPVEPAHLMAEVVQHHCWLVTGLEDKVCDPRTAAAAARELPKGHFLAIPKCGHAPQIEKHWLINRVVVQFLSAAQPTARPAA